MSTLQVSGFQQSAGSYQQSSCFQESIFSKNRIVKDIKQHPDAGNNEI
jgi:hypothetical protein